nr:hypothetical protein [Tanacetum cinerariifolium]
MVYVVINVSASNVEIILELEFVRYAILELEIREYNFYEYGYFETPSSDAITASPPILQIEDPEVSFIMGNEELNTILEKESDEFIKSSVEDLVLIPSESEDTFESESVCILPSCDDFSPNDMLEEKAVTFSSPLFEFDDKYISSDVNPLFNEVLENIKIMDSYDSNLDESDLLVTPLFDANKDECFDSGGDDDEINVLDCEDGYYDSEGDILYLESLLNDDLVHCDLSIPAMSVASILEGFTNEPSLKENDDLFDLEPKNDAGRGFLHCDLSIPAMSVASILEGFTDEPSLKENDDLFDLEPKNDAGRGFCMMLIF